MSDLQILRRFLTALVLVSVLGLLLAACQLAEAKPPEGGWYAPATLVTCQPVDAKQLLGPERLEGCRAHKGCMEGMAKTAACLSCLGASCCTETKACDLNAFPPESPARAEAARCSCVLRCRSQRPLAECRSDERCGQATDPSTERYPALASCQDAHCADVCPKEKRGPIP